MWNSLVKDLGQSNGNLTAVDDSIIEFEAVKSFVPLSLEESQLQFFISQLSALRDPNNESTPEQKAEYERQLRISIKGNDSAVPMEVDDE